MAVLVLRDHRLVRWHGRDRHTYFAPVRLNKVNLMRLKVRHELWFLVILDKLVPRPSVIERGIRVEPPEPHTVA